jgi:nicotinate phosphoribosyltransferase
MPLPPGGLALMTDLYELTMAQSYLRQRMTAPATFSLFIRKYPQDRAYFVAAGLEHVLRYLQEFHYSQDDLDYLRGTGIFGGDLLDHLADLRFTGDVWAMPEGELFFANEPVLEVTAPVIQAQLAETFIINQVNVQTIQATKAARCVWAAGGKQVIDFSFRRTQGVEAGVLMARAAAIAGFQGTSNVLAGKLLGVPVVGTMAHSYIEAFTREEDAFRAFAADFPERSVLLIDTYDTVAGARKAAVVGREMAARGQKLLGVRLDSGDMADLSRQVRRILDDAGLNETAIVASGGLDEHQVEELVKGGAPIDTFAVGTRVGVSDDAPHTDMAYKLVRYAGRPVLKTSMGKATLPGEKQVYRFTDGADTMTRDLITLREEPAPAGGRHLLELVMTGGRLVRPLPSLPQIAERLRAACAALPGRYRALRNPPAYPVDVSQPLQRLTERVQGEVAS